MKMLSVLIASAMLSGCSLLPRQTVLPNPNIPHRVAEDATVKVWVRRPDGKLVKEPVKLGEGWWIASPQVVEPSR